jgi:hypothetical protein
VQILQFLVIQVLHQKVSQKKAPHLVAQMGGSVGWDPRSPKYRLHSVSQVAGRLEAEVLVNGIGSVTGKEREPAGGKFRSTD